MGRVEGADPRRYHRRQLLLGLLGLAVTAAYLAAVLLAGLAPQVDALARRLAGALPWRVAIVALAVGGLHWLLTLPLAWLRGYWLPRQYGLLHQPLGAWLGDRAKAALIGGLLGLLSLEVVYALLASTPWWWLWAALALVALELAVTVVFPVWLLPLFYRLTPLADDDLRRALLALAERAGTPALGVWVADQSRKSRTANAAVAGLGGTRRILLFDTLLARFRPDEIEAVLAHELAHRVHHDHWRALGVQALVTLAALRITDGLLRAGVPLWGLNGPADPAGVPWLAAIGLGLGLLATPAVNAFSRRLERQADDFALALTRDIDGFVGAMRRLAELNLAEPDPHPLKEFLLYSHPSVGRRIARARARG